ncbi:hypothetical protein BC829DRAFT_458829 [Chytridium lagenaria]|nr:hypothetical protein BC829DRAFT_458829 [Chytridium lagenaria]
MEHYPLFTTENPSDAFFFKATLTTNIHRGRPAVHDTWWFLFVTTNFLVDEITDNGSVLFHPRLFHLTDLTFDAVVYSRSALTLDPRFTTIPAPGAARASSAPAQPPRVSTPGTPAVSSVQTSTAALVSQQQLFSPSLPAFSPLTSIIPSDDDEYVPDNADEAFDDIESEVSLTRRRRSYTLDPSFPSRPVHSNLSWIQPGPTPAASNNDGRSFTSPPSPIPPVPTMSGAGGSTSFSRSSSTASLAGSGKIKDGMNAKSAKDDMATVVLDSPQPASIYRFIAKIESILSQYVTDPTKPDLARPFDDLEHAFRVTWNPVITYDPQLILWLIWFLEPQRR